MTYNKICTLSNVVKHFNNSFLDRKNVLFEHNIFQKLKIDQLKYKNASIISMILKLTAYF